MFVDPEVQINDYHGSDWKGWGTVATPYNPTPNTRNYYGASAANCAYYCGLYLSMPTNTAYSYTGTSIYWQYRAIANTYIYAGTLGGMSHTPTMPFAAAYGAPYNTYPYVFSRWFNGIFNGTFTNWEANTNYLNQGGAYGPNPFGPTWGGASGVTHAFCLTAPGPRCDRENTPPSDSNALILGLNAQNDLNTTDINTANSRASVTMAWANTYLNDRYNPSIGSPTPPSKEWTDDSAMPDHPLDVNVLDAGLGAYDVTLTGWGTGTQTSYRSATCTGDPQRNPCPLNWSPPALSYRLNEGVNTLTLRATDIVDNAAAPQTWTEKIDRAAPTITPSDSLYNARQTTLAPGSYSLRVQASDGATTSGAARRSGVTRVATYIDDEEVDIYEAGCAIDSCSVTRDITINTDNYPGGRHTVEMEAVDALGHTSTSTFTFTTPCCTTAGTQAGTSTAADRVLYADVTGDGRADLVTVSTLGNVSVTPSNGETFASPSSWGSIPVTALSGLELGDLDGDGKSDLLYREPTLDPNDLNAQRAQVRVSTGTAFAPATNWGMWSADYDTTIADVDDDDFGDLIGRSSSGDVIVAPSLRDRFDASTSWASTDPSFDWATADATGDGQSDLVLRDPASGALTVRASSSSSFTSASAWGSAPGSGDLRYGDLDASGSGDILLRTTSSGVIKVAVSDSKQYLPLADWGTVASGDVQLDLADIDGDSRDDVLTRNTTTGTITAYRSTSMPTIADDDPFVADPDISYDEEDSLSGEAQARAASAAGTATMKIAWSDDAVLVGTRNNAPADSFTAADPTRANAALRRMRQTGASSVRLIVLWGHWQQRTNPGSSYREAMIAAINRIHAMGMTVYVTITGAWYDDLLNGQRTSLNPSPSAFSELVTDIVSTFRPLGVRDYAMWNEPNLPMKTGRVPGALASFLERPVCTNGRVLTTAKLYQRLYLAGDAAANAINPDVRVYIGELSEQANAGHPECSSAKNSLNTLNYLTDVVTDPPGGGAVTTNGVAWHPYQGRLTPSKPAYNIVGIGRINGMRSRVQNLIRAGKLLTPTGAGPRLYLTEFGYFNRPLVQNRREGFYSESRRAGWLRGALKRAREASPRPGMFTFYKLIEAWPTPLVDPTQTNNQPVAEDDLVNNVPGAFDTGVVHPLTFAVTGVRPYGIGNIGQLRDAFCAIRADIKDQPGYSVSSDNTGLPDQCP